MLTELGTVFCDSDSPRHRPIGWVTARTAYLRLHGRSRWYSHQYSSEELLEIVSWVREVLRAGVLEIYIFFNNDFHAYAPRNAQELKELLRKELNGNQSFS